METKYCVISGGNEPIYRKIDEFFQEVINEIGVDKDRPISLQFRVEVENHCRKNDGGLTDNCTHILYHKEQPVATVIETRDERNWVRFTFFKNLDDLI